MLDCVVSYCGGSHVRPQVEWKYGFIYPVFPSPLNWFCGSVLHVITLVMESRIKAFFGMSASNQTKLIREASARASVEVPANAETGEGTSTLLGNEFDDVVEAVELEEELERQIVFELNSNLEETLNLDTEKTS